MKDELSDRYFLHLTRMMRIDLPEHRNFNRLLNQLYSTEFYFVHPLDENRLLDGMELRDLYLRGRSLPMPPCVLEVLAAFSKRIEENILGEPGNDRYERMFWVMLNNLGLLYFEDFKYDEEKVSMILQNWMSRKSKKSALFPLKKTTRDESELDFWWQMQLYVDENY